MAGSTLGGVMRTVLAALLLVLLLPTMVLANASYWAVRSVVDDTVFATTVGDVLDSPTLRATIAQRVSDDVTAYLASEPETLRVLATEILHVDASASVDQIRSALRAALASAYDDPAVRQARDEAIARVHAYLVGAATGTSGPVRIEGDELVLDTGRLMERLAAAVDPRLTPTMVRLPASDRIVVLARADAIETTSNAVSLLQVVQILIPVVAILAALAILGLAHRRVRALGLVGIAITVAGVVTLAAAWLGGAAVGSASTDPTVRQMSTEVYSAFTKLLVWQSAVLIVGGLVLAVVAWVTLRRRRGASAASTGSSGASPA
jgi:hypothetical protein